MSCSTAGYLVFTFLLCNLRSVSIFATLFGIVSQKSEIYLVATIYYYYCKEMFIMGFMIWLLGVPAESYESLAAKVTSHKVVFSFHFREN